MTCDERPTPSPEPIPSASPSRDVKNVAPEHRGSTGKSVLCVPVVICVASLWACNSLAPPDAVTGPSSSSSSSGSSEESSSSSSGSSDVRGEISIRFVTNVSCNQDFPIDSIETFENPAVPSSPELNTDYGPSDSGTFHGGFKSGSLTVPFTYKISRPSNGMHRAYRMQLVDYDAQLNDCVSVVTEPSALHYDDVPIDSWSPSSSTSSSSSSGGTTTGGKIYVVFIYQSGCQVSNISATNSPNIYLGQTYGPLPEGFYEGSFVYTPQPQPQAGSPSTMPFSFYMKRPAAGTKRTYQVYPMMWDTSLNACVFGGNSGLYKDEADQ